MQDEARDPVTEPGQVEDIQEEVAGQPEQSDQTEASGETEVETQSFTDPNEIPESLQPIYKQMQGDYTRKTQELAAQRKKVEAYDAFMQNPQASIQQMAQQYGITLQQAAEAKAEAQEFNPQSWDDVVGHVRKQVEQDLMSQIQKQYEPVVNEVRNWKKNQIEQKLDAEFPQWREYEDQMSQVLQQHPSLVGDPSMLLRAVVPREVVESQATKRALEKLKAKAEGAKVSSGSQTNRQKSNMPSGPVSFQDAVEFAKRQLAEQGIRPT